MDVGEIEVVTDTGLFTVTVLLKAEVAPVDAAHIFIASPRE